MTRRAFSLHEEVVDAMYSKNVDPMERNFHSGMDKMKSEALFRQHLEESNPVPSYRSTNLDFWKGFNVNQKYLKAKSAADIRKQAKKKKKKINPLLNRKNEMPALQLQDQKTPARSLTCKFPPPAAEVFRENRLSYDVKDLMEFSSKKNDPKYRPQPLEVIDPFACDSREGVIYQPPGKKKDEETTEVNKALDEKMKTNKEGGAEGNMCLVAGEHESHIHQSGSSPSVNKSSASPGELAGHSNSDERVRNENSADKDLLMVGERDSHVLLSPSAVQNTSSSMDNRFHDSFASNTLEKHSVSGTVVPSLNLSGVIASQMSDSKIKERDSGYDNDDNRTADFAFIDEDATDNLDQQPSFAFTDGNEDFFFAKSMMDGTFATNTVVDDQTKGTIPTCDPSKRLISRKERRRLRREREAKKKLLKPMKGVYGDIGGLVPGGMMGQGPARQKQGRRATEMCNFHTVEELDGGLRTVKGGQFLAANRFPSNNQASTSGNGTSSSAVYNNQTNGAAKLPRSSGRFSGAKRFTETVNKNPAPGDYNMNRLFDDMPVGKGKRITAERTEELVKKIEEERMLRNQNCNFMSNQAVFGYGCSIEEHIKYGLCLDGKCGRRAKWEDVMLLTQDEDRLGHGGGINMSPNKSGKDQQSVSVNFSMSQQALSSIEELRKTLRSADNLDFSPLKTASLRGDFDTVVQLCLLGADINERDKLQQTILHQAVLRNYLHIIVCLTEVPGYSECLDDDLKKICRTKSLGLFTGIVDLNAQDWQGNTPLHIAAMRGNSLMAEVLCDAGANPDGIKNKDGKTPSDVAKTQHLFQVVKMAQARYEACEELKALRKSRHEVHTVQNKRAERVNSDSTDVDEKEDEDEEEEDEGENDTEEYEVYEEIEDNKSDSVDKTKTNDEQIDEEREMRIDARPVSKHANKQHSYYVGYFGTPQKPKKKQSEREKYARFLNMRMR